MLYRTRFTDINLASNVKKAKKIQILSTNWLFLYFSKRKKSLQSMTRSSRSFEKEDRITEIRVTRFIFLKQINWSLYPCECIDKCLNFSSFHLATKNEKFFERPKRNLKFNFPQAPSFFLQDSFGYFPLPFTKQETLSFIKM